MKGYILRWNPNISSFSLETFNKMLIELKKYPALCIDWSVYDYGTLTPGDFFIMQQVGTNNDGVVNFGSFTSDPYPAENWHKNNPHKCFYAKIEYTFAIDRGKTNAPLAAQTFEKEFPQVNFHHGHSGEQISQDTMESLVLKMVQELFFYKESDDCIAFNNLHDFRQMLCNYISLCCPNIKTLLIDRNFNRLEKKLQRDLADVDKNCLNLTYDKDSLNKITAPITKDDLFNFIIPML